MICQKCHQTYKEDEGTWALCEKCADEAYQQHMEDMQQKYDEDAENFIRRKDAYNYT